MTILVAILSFFVAFFLLLKLIEVVGAVFIAVGNAISWLFNRPLVVNASPEALSSCFWILFIVGFTALNLLIS
ncbi:MAG: hypothetical protein ABFC77_15530 [Thermoguttaceae bacterium]|jgi:hypothetical protein